MTAHRFTNRLTANFRTQPVIRVRLFGSQADDTATEERDIPSKHCDL